MTNPVVLLVEDHALLVESLAVALGADGIDVHRPVTLDAAAVLSAVEMHRPQVVLLDLHLDETSTSTAMIPALVALGTSVVMLTAETDQARLGACIEAGASGLIAKTDSFDWLVTAVRDAVGGVHLLSRSQRTDLLAAVRKRRTDDAARLAPFTALTPREREVLGALRDGRTAEWMAATWYVSITTVRSQIRAVHQKLGVTSQLAAVAAARAAGWTIDT